VAKDTRTTEPEVGTAWGPVEKQIIGSVVKIPCSLGKLGQFIIHPESECFGHFG